MNRPVLMRAAACMLTLASLAGSACADDASKPLPLSTTTSIGNYEATISKPLTIAQQRARYEADQRMMRMQWNKWIGYEPARPALPNALTNNELNPYFLQPVRYRPVWGVLNNGSRIW